MHLESESRNPVRRRLRRSLPTQRIALVVMMLFSMGVGIGIDRFAVQQGIVDAANGFQSDEFDIVSETYDVIREKGKVPYARFVCNKTYAPRLCWHIKAVSLTTFTCRSNHW